MPKTMRGGEGCGKLGMGGSRKKRGGGSCGAPLSGGRRRKMRGGMYGFSGAAITAGTLESSAAYTGAADPKTGAPVSDPTLKGTPSEGSYTGVGGRRRRTAKKGRKSRKTRKSRKSRMRGGASGISAMKAGYGFTGTGSAGLADATPTSTSGGNAF